MSLFISAEIYAYLMGESNLKNKYEKYKQVSKWPVHFVDVLL